MNNTLDGWYRIINRIYLDHNFYRNPESIFSHLVEVAGGLSLAASKKKKGNLDPRDFLPKSIGWWLALCGRVGVPSVEQMLWAKFPSVCPYCQLERHDGNRCKQKRKERERIDWESLNNIALKNKDQRPQTLSEWQKMYGKIYVRDENTNHEKNFSRLAEELGELAEAIRTLAVAPQYFVSEAPDVFAWLMGFANQFDHERDIQFEQYGKALEDSMQIEYPNTCRVCGWETCKCPPVLAATLGRIAKEAPIDYLFSSKRLFSIEESMNMFGRSETILKIGNRSIRPNKAEFDQIAEDVKKILRVLEEQSKYQPEILVKIVATLAKVETLAHQGAITQVTVDNIKCFLSELPKEERTTIYNFINNLSASATFQAICELIKPLMQ